MYKISSFKSIEKKHDVYRFKDSIKTFCESLREHTMKIINFKKNEIINKRAAELMKKCKSLIYFSKKKKKKKKKLKMNMRKIKNIVKLKIIVVIQGNIVVLRTA